MRKLSISLIALGLLAACAASVQEQRATLEGAAKSPSPFSVNLADNIARLNLAVDQILPIHGRMVPLAELHRTIGRGN